MLKRIIVSVLFLLLHRNTIICTHLEHNALCFDITATRHRLMYISFHCSTAGFFSAFLDAQ